MDSSKNRNLIDEKKYFRSLIKEYFPVTLLIELDKLTMNHSIDNNKKAVKIKELLTQYKVPFSALGNGTNRYGILVDGYAVKIALDRMGKTDNKREFLYTKELFPDVVKVYECTQTGLLAVSEYVNIFSLDDYYEHQDDMRVILEKISSRFLVGDIGVTTQNYVNWGTRLDGSICILDFAYIYSLSYKSFKCTCEDEGILEFDNDYVYLICPYCRKKYSFSDIRRRITKKDEEEEIGNIMDIGYNLSDKRELKNIDLRETPIKEDIKKKPKKVHLKKKDKEEKAMYNIELSAEEQKRLLDEMKKEYNL